MVTSCVCLPLVLASTMVALRPGAQERAARVAPSRAQSTAPAPASDLIERVLAVVAGRVITLTDVTAARAFGLVPELSPFSDLTRGTLTALIERALMLTEVDRYALTEPDEQTVAADMQAIRAGFPGDEAFAAALDRTGLDEGRLREMVRENERIRAYLRQRFPGLPLGDDDVRRYYDGHRERFGNATSFEDVQGLVLAAAMAEQRRLRIADWLAGLRGRADVIDLWLPEP